MDNAVPAKALLDLAKEITAKDKQLQLQGVQIAEFPSIVGKIADLALNTCGVPGGTEAEFDIFWFYDLFNSYVFGDCSFEEFAKGFELQLAECMRTHAGDRYKTLLGKASLLGEVSLVNSGQIVGG